MFLGNRAKSGRNILRIWTNRPQILYTKPSKSNFTENIGEYDKNE